MAGNPVARFARCVGGLILLFGMAGAARAADPDPLAPPVSTSPLAPRATSSPLAPRVTSSPLAPLDTSSPQATLLGFIAAVDDVYTGMTAVLEEYARSDRLYLDPALRRKQLDILRRAPKAMRALDLSGISPVLMGTTPAERMLQLKEVLDRIELPAAADIPDRDAMERLHLKRWRLPGTEIDIAQIQEGPRAGEYLVASETVDRLHEFYQKVRGMPYKPGPAKALNDVFATLSGGRTDTLYEAFLSSPVGLATVIPPRWILSLPAWARVPVFGVTAWQWTGLAIGFLIGFLCILVAHRLHRRVVAPVEEERGVSLRAVPVPLAINLVAAFLVPVLCMLFRIGGTPRVIIAYGEAMAFSFTAAWLSMVGLIIVGDVIVASEHLKRSSLDSQLVRLGARLVGVMCAIAFLIRGADDLGFPAYSVLAGLGVGGLAVALAARDSLANLLGSLLIMVEKPFRIGHFIRLGGHEGTVEDVGFRSTRIRTQDNSLISIPNNVVVNAMVENLSLRAMRRQRFFLQVTYDTPRDKVEALVSGVRRVILERPSANKTNLEVRFNNFAESSLDILVIFHLHVADYSAEISEREAILLQTMDLMNELGVAFAFPTRTLQIEGALPAMQAVNAPPAAPPFAAPPHIPPEAA